jgi:NTP pyrophosphatase (non-canonical NTP hydrolase)
MNLETLAQEAFQRLAQRKGWSRLHNARSLATAVATEAAELLQEVQWLSDDEAKAPSDELRARMADEMADVYLYLVALARHLNLSLEAIVSKKIRDNEQR